MRKKVTSIEDDITRFYEDLKAGKCITVEYGSDEFYKIFNKIKRPKISVAPNGSKKTVKTKVAVSKRSSKAGGK